ncbi:putative Bax inhibitor-1 [Besnoitia besnoiti]|uniref:Putative Bax inhibitor-1 n=1 Tax=Besnoitia besnoiti TaxID=94643 RepID=A0A2A9MAV9_BESBE|nr:putative Bax inhibitor-1 [Besnoitia besnoiti]PFH33441.1 putative Bax inhibitor-1 [Besnoitia besnoiti]
MNVFEQYNQRQGAMNLKHIFSFAPLSPVQQEHLTRVYGALLTNIVLTAAGVYVQQQLVALPLFLLLGVQFLCIWGLSGTSTEAVYTGKVTTPLRAAYFGGFGFASGMMLGDYIYFINALNSSIIPTAFIVSMGIFASLSAAAIVSRDRKFIYLGSILGTGLTLFTYLSLFSVMWRTKLADDILLWGGLLLYVGFVLFDTQVALEMARRGSSDYLVQAIQFYVDLFGIFIRLVHILADKERRKRQRDEE